MSVFNRERLAEIERERVPRPVHTVLVVDDEEGNLRVLRAMLGERYRVLQATDGLAALELLNSLGPDESPCVILSDQRMPRMTGVELFERARENLPDCIRIIITGFVDVGAIVDAINRAGIYKFVVKPFDRTDLLLTMERAVEAWELRRQLDDYVVQLEEKVRERTRELEAKNQALALLNAEMERASLTDPLTGLGNRRFFNQEVVERRDRRRAGPSRIANLLIDIDHFKSVNDEFGHAAGDLVLSSMGEILRRQQRREDDVAVRWGGEEFLLRLSVDDEAAGLAFAENLRAEVAATAFDIGEGRQLRRSCSIGVACDPVDPAAPEGLTLSRVLALADAALYMAKRGGRNAVLCLMPTGPLPEGFDRRIAEEAEALIAEGVLKKLTIR